MAYIKSIEIDGDETRLNMKISNEEHAIIQSRTEDLLILPADKSSLTKSLTTGKLGNSNRIMLPKKLLEGERIGQPDKKVPAQTYRVGGDVYLLIKLKKSDIGKPKFGVDDDGKG